MKVAFLAGGMGSRLAEETVIRPKAMVEIGGRPILWHIMKIYSSFGYRDFVVALGYKGDYIKRYMLDYCALNSDLKVHVGSGTVTAASDSTPEDWDVELIDTGPTTYTGGRIKRLKPYVGNQTFMLTWSDGVANVDLDALLRFHRSHGKLATVTAVRPSARFGRLEIHDGAVTDFSEKPQMTEGWINGAYFVLEPGIFDYIDGDQTQWEYEPMERLVEDGQLMAFQHDGFWQCMDTIRDRKLLESLWASEKPPWKTWE